MKEPFSPEPRESIQVRKTIPLCLGAGWAGTLLVTPGTSLGLGASYATEARGTRPTGFPPDAGRGEFQAHICLAPDHSLISAGR